MDRGAARLMGIPVPHVLAWLEPLLDTPAPSDLRPIRLGNHYAGLKITEAEDAHPIHAVVRDMAEKAAEYGPGATRKRLRSLMKRLEERLRVEESDRILDMRPTVRAAVRLEDFLRTRVIEFVVHADDLAVSVGVDPPERPR